MKIVILEDNISNAWEYEMIFEKLGFEDTQVFKTTSTALAEVKKSGADLCIVDLYLSNNGSGFEFAEKLKKYDIPFIICTGYPKEKYMDRAFELGAAGFFSKPIDKAAFTFFVRNMIFKLQSKNDGSEYVVFKDGRVIKKIAQENILFAKIDGNYVTIKTIAHGKIVLKMSLLALTKKLSENIFERCHRSALVNIEQIDHLDFESNQVVLNNQDKLPIGLQYKNKLMLRFMRKE